MYFWFVIIAILAVTLVVLWRSWSSSLDTNVTPEASELALYNARIEEIERDIEAARIYPEMAEAAKAEEARKLLKNRQAGDHQTEASVGQPSGWWMTLGLFSVPLISVLIYLSLGTPPGSLQQPAPTEVVEQSMEQLVASAERRLETNPDDLQGWQVLVPVYIRQQNYEKAENAFRNIIRINGESTQLLSAFGEVLVAKANGEVSAEAQELFEKAADLEPGNPTAQFFLGLAKLQKADTAGARTIWQSMIDGASGDEDWLPVIRQRVAELETNTKPGLNKHKAEAAAEIAALPKEEQQARVLSMVSGLAQRLSENPDDKAGWIRLVRAYMVLGMTEEAEEAFQTATETFKEDQEFLTQLEKTRIGPKGAIN